MGEDIKNQISKINRYQKIFLIFILLFCFLIFNFYIPSSTFAQTKGIEITQTYMISDSGVVDGDIVSNTKEGIIKSKIGYDSRILGVVQFNPLIVFRAVEDIEKPVVRQGTAYVNVTTVNGDINKGDFITTSEIAGKGQKATVTGYVLGIALDSLSSTASGQLNYKDKVLNSGQIPVGIRIEYANITGSRIPTQILDQIITGLLQNITSQDQLVQFTKYLVALLVFLSSLVFSFLTFSKVITKGIEGLGRNPLARTSIQISIILNIILVIITTIMGLGAAILIIRI